MFFFVCIFSMVIYNIYNSLILILEFGLIVLLYHMDYVYSPGIVAHSYVINILIGQPQGAYILNCLWPMWNVQSHRKTQGDKTMNGAWDWHWYEPPFIH